MSRQRDIQQTLLNLISNWHSRHFASMSIKYLLRRYIFADSRLFKRNQAAQMFLLTIDQYHRLLRAVKSDKSQNTVALPTVQKTEGSGAKYIALLVEMNRFPVQAQ